MFASLLGSYLTSGTLPVYLTDPTNGTSNTLSVTVGTITLTQISPAILTASTAASLTLLGANFTASSIVYFNGVAVPAQYATPTELIAAIPASLVTSGTLPVYVRDPATGISGTLYAAVNPGSGGISVNSLSPAGTAINSGPLTLTIFGSGFTSGALLNFGAICAITTIFVSAGEPSAVIPAFCLTTAQTVNVSIGSGNALPFVIAGISLSAVSPTTLLAGNQTTLYLCGANFTPNSTVYFSNTPVATFFLDSGSLVATVPYQSDTPRGAGGLMSWAASKAVGDSSRGIARCSSPPS